MSNVSIIITYFNDYLTIDKCISSLLNQSYRFFQCIIIDDGSEKYPFIDHCRLSLDVRFKIVVLPTNKGRGFARNIGLSHVKGDYFGFLDSDDWYHPNKISSQINEFKRDVKISAVSSGMNITNLQGMPIGVFRYRFGIHTHLRKNYFCNIPFAPTLFRKKDLGSLKFDATLRECEDIDFLNNFLLGKSYFICKENLYYYRINQFTFQENVIKRLKITKDIVPSINLDIKLLTYSVFSKLGLNPIISKLRLSKFSFNDKKIQNLNFCDELTTYNKHVIKCDGLSKIIKDEIYTIISITKRNHSVLLKYPYIIESFFNYNVTFNPLNALLGFFNIYYSIVKLKPTVISAYSVKASFIPLLVAYILGINKRVYYPLEVKLSHYAPLMKRLLSFINCINIFLAQRIYCNKETMIILLKNKFISHEKFVVLQTAK